MPAYPEFSPRPPWIGPDLQTLRNKLRPPRTEFDRDARRLLLATSDGTGDQLSGVLHGGAGDGGGALVVLMHGLGGCEDSDYVRVTASLLLSRGARVMRLNLRGAGASRPTCRLQYHAGRSRDLADVLDALLRSGEASRFFLVGYSLGGNMLLKFLAEYGSEYPVAGAVSVSAPIDLGSACRRILETRNAPYHRYLLRMIREESLAAGAEISAAEREAVLSATSIYEFDRDFVAPRNGYASAEEYYEVNQASRFLPDIETPTVVIHSLDDPWIPGDAYEAFDWASNPYLTLLLAQRGGHVGFHGRDRSAPWHDRCIGMFLDEVGGRPDLVEPARVC